MQPNCSSGGGGGGGKEHKTHTHSHDWEYNYSAPPHLVAGSYSLERMHLLTEMYIISHQMQDSLGLNIIELNFNLICSAYWIVVIKYCEYTIHLS